MWISTPRKRQRRSNSARNPGSGGRFVCQATRCANDRGLGATALDMMHPKQ